jgi:hypothetical protein
MLDVNDKAYLYDSGRTRRYLSIEQLGGNKLKKQNNPNEMKLLLNKLNLNELPEQMHLRMTSQS